MKIPNLQILSLLFALACLGAPESAHAIFPFLKRTPKAPTFVGEPGADFETHLRIQIYLDRKGFGPGKLDGAIGTFTRRAVDFYNGSHGHAAGNWYPVLSQSTAELETLYKAYQIKQGDLRYVNASLPHKPEEQVEHKYMSYRSLAEFVAERFHTTEKTIARLNPRLNLKRLKPGDLVIGPNVIPFEIEAVPRDRQFKSEPTLSARSVVVDTKSRMASFHIGAPDSAVFAAFPITPGKKQFIPYGTWKVKIMITTPEFRYDKKMLQEGERSDEAWMIPPGPNSPVGIFWAGLTKSGIGLHGTSSPETIGRSESAGCIRLANWDAIRLQNLIRPGAVVVVR